MSTDYKNTHLKDRSKAIFKTKKKRDYKISLCTLPFSFSSKLEMSSWKSNSIIDDFVFYNF